MPRLRVTASLPQLDRERYLSDYKKSVEQAFIKAARKFLLAAVPLIPQFTGFARGALGNLEDVVGRVQGGRIDGRRKGVKKVKALQPRTYYYYPNKGSRVVRNNITGRAFATKPGQIFGSGNITRATTKARMLFKFSVDIKYFDYLDKNKWGAFKAGREAFNQELKIQLERLRPKIGNYIVRRAIK